jgi:hypothetical protein
MKDIYEIGLNSELLIYNEMYPSYFINSNANIENVEKFTKEIVDKCISIIDKEYTPGDLSERTVGIRRARNAIRKHFSEL